MNDTIEVPEDLIECEVQLIGTDGNAGALMGQVSQALKRAGNSSQTINAFRREAMSGDYNHLLQACMAYAIVS